MPLVEVFSGEIKGDLYVVGDIHGCHTLLMNQLNDVGFDFENDLLVSVGDLVDRGSQNLECVELISKPWFKSIRGNHEDLCIGGLHDESYRRCHISNGGEWFYSLDEQSMSIIAKTFSELPIVLEIKHHGKKFGFVHGHIEQNNWEEFKASFNYMQSQRPPAELAMWGRERLNSDATQYTYVSGVDAVFCGHTVVSNVCKRDNVFFIDIGSCFTGRLAVLNLSEMFK